MAESATMSTVPFTWEGTDREGQKVKGKAMATNEAAVRADLSRQGVVPIRIKKQNKGLFASGGTVTPADIAIFMRQLATMLGAGIPLVQSFEIVGNGHENAAMQKLILAVKADVEGGTALADAFAKHPLHFDDLVRLTDCFDALIADGHSLLIVEHNPLLMLTADHLIDIGPGAGQDGGRIVAEGSVDDLVASQESVTGQILAVERKR